MTKYGVCGMVRPQPANLRNINDQGSAAEEGQVEVKNKAESVGNRFKKERYGD